MLKTGDICLWNDGALLQRAVVVDGPKPASAFHVDARTDRVDSYAMIASLQSGETAVVHADELKPVSGSTLLA